MWAFTRQEGCDVKTLLMCIMGSIRSSIFGASHLIVSYGILLYSPCLALNCFEKTNCPVNRRKNIILWHHNPTLSILLHRNNLIQTCLVRDIVIWILLLLLQLLLTAEAIWQQPPNSCLWWQRRLISKRTIIAAAVPLLLSLLLLLQLECQMWCLCGSLVHGYVYGLHWATETCIMWATTYLSYNVLLGKPVWTSLYFTERKTHQWYKKFKPSARGYKII